MCVRVCVCVGGGGGGPVYMSVPAQVTGDINPKVPGAAADSL